MALLGISLIVASAVLFCFRRPQWILSFLGPWLQPPSLGAPSPTPLSQDKKEGANDLGDISEEEATAQPQNGAPPPIIRSPQTDPETTPKAAPAARNDSVPTFTLSGHDDDNDSQIPQAPIIPLPSSPALGPKATTATPSTLMAPPPRPSGSMAPPPSLPSGPGMAPPPKPSASSRLSMPSPPPRPPTLAPLSSSSVPRPSPLPGRLSTQPRQPGSSTLAPPPSHTSIPTKPSRQVVLTQGHSPLDWARLSASPTADLRNLPGGPSAPYLRVTPSMLKKMTGRRGKDAWTVLGGKVYNMTPYVPFHPGGEAELLRGAGRDGTRLFGEVHPWVNYEGMLASCLVGILVGEGEGQEQSGGSMEEMD